VRASKQAFMMARRLKRRADGLYAQEVGAFACRSASERSARRFVKSEPCCCANRPLLYVAGVGVIGAPQIMSRGGDPAEAAGNPAATQHRYTTRGFQRGWPQFDR
jgi:hypothetical protein